MYSILIVDGDARFAEHLVRKIEWDGLGVKRVVTAQDGHSALQMAAELRPELVLSEMRLPDLTGPEWVSRLPDEEYIGKIAFLSGRPDFQAARAAMRLKAVDCLLKPVGAGEVQDVVVRMIREIERQSIVSMRMWMRARELLRRGFVESLLRGAKYYSDQTFHEQARPLRLEWLDALPSAVLAIGNDGGKAEAAGRRERDLVAFAVDNVLQEMSERLEYGILLPWGEGGWAAVVGVPPEKGAGATEASYGYLQEVAEAWIAAVRHNTHGRIAIGVSLLHTQWNGLPYRLGQALEALAIKGLMREERVLRYDRTVAALKAEAADRLDVNRLLRDLQLGDKEAIRYQLKGLPEGLAPHARTGGGPIADSWFGWLRRIHLILEQAGQLPADLIAPGLLREQLGDTDDEAYLRDRVIAHFMHLCDLIHPSTGDVMQKALDFIASNLAARIKIEDVAARLYISPIWLSRLFRTKLGMTFLQYLTQRRMEEAKLLLKHSGLPVQDIAARLGYEDTVYFTKLFKRHAGVSPSKFRRPYT